MTCLKHGLALLTNYYDSNCHKHENNRVACFTHQLKMITIITMQIIIDTIIGECSDRFVERWTENLLLPMAIFGVSSYLSHIHDPEHTWKSEGFTESM